MSRYYYVCANTMLEDIPNPYLESLSINEALSKGLELDLELLKDVDAHEKGVILYCEKEENFYYPNLFSVDIEDVKNLVNTKMKYALCLECGMVDTYMDDLCTIIENLLKAKGNLELWSIWLNDAIQYHPIYLDATKENLKRNIKEFFKSEKDCICLTIINE